MRLSILVPVAAWVASGACQAPPTASLPDPLAFVQERFADLDPIAQRMWTEIYAAREREDDFGAGGAGFLETPAMQELWAEIQSLLRPHPTQRTLRLAAADDSGLQCAAAVEVVDLAVPEGSTNHLKDWIWLREHQGRWVIAGLGLVDPTASKDLPLSRQARPLIRVGEDWDPPLVLSWNTPRNGDGERRLAADFRPWWPKHDPVSELHGAERIACELARTLPKLRDMRPDGTLLLRVEALADLLLRELRILLGPGPDSAPEAWELALQVWLDGSRRPGELRFERPFADPAESWPSSVHTAPPPPTVGLDLTPQCTVQDLCATADALLVLGVKTLFLAEPAAVPR